MVGKRIFKYTCFIIAFLISYHHTVFATIPQHTPSFYVNDFANVLTQETVSHINQKSSLLDEASGAQIVVTTVDFTGGVDIEEYATNMFNEWGIGDSVQNNGILLLLVIGEEDYFIATGDGTHNIITAGQIDQIVLTYLEDDFELKNYDQGVLNTFDEIYNRMASFYNVNLDNMYAAANGGSNNNPTNNLDYTQLGHTGIQSTNNNNTGNSFFFYFVLLILFLMIVPALSGGRRRRRGLGRSSLFWWLMPSPLSRNRRRRNNLTPPPQLNSRYKGNSTSFGGGGKSSSGIGRGGNRLGGGGRSSGGGVGRRR